MVSFVYIYLHSQSQGDELRWSIRSIEKYCRDEFEVVIAGDRPPWFKGVCLDIEKQGGWFHDTHRKLLIATQDKRVSDRFVWMMDDIYFMRPFTLDELAIPRARRTFTREDVENYIPEEGNKWQIARRKSFDEILKTFDVVHDYATHLPHVVEKSKLELMFSKWDMLNSGFLFELMYGALWWPNPMSSKTLRYIDQPTEVSDLQVYCQSCMVLNNGNGAWNSTLRNFLKARFPKISRNELYYNEVTDTREAMKQAMAEGRDIREFLHPEKNLVICASRSAGFRYSIRSMVENYSKPFEVVFYKKRPDWFIGDVVDTVTGISPILPHPVIFCRTSGELEPVEIDSSKIRQVEDVDVLRAGRPVVSFSVWTGIVERWAKSRFPVESQYEYSSEILEKAPWNGHCRYRGTGIRDEAGKYCPYRSKPQRVYECEKHGECCRVDLGIPGIKACNRCSVALEMAGMT